MILTVLNHLFFQVKNFGRSGRTKYTHLVDQDTTQFDSPWIADTAQNLKTHMTKGGGMKQVFNRPAAKSKRKWKQVQWSVKGKFCGCAWLVLRKCIVMIASVFRKKTCYI